MADEVLKRDQNDVTVLGAITNDSNQFIKMLRIDPATGRLIVSAVIAGTYNGQLLVSAADTTYGYLFSKLTAGTGISLAITNAGGNETVEITATGTGYTTVQENGNPLTQRTKLNFLNGFDVTDNVGNTSTDVVIDETELDLGDMGGLLDLSTQVTGVLNSTYIDISDLESNLDLANIAGLLNISSQITGVLPLANGGTGVALTDPNANKLLGFDDTDGTIGFWTLGTGLSYDHSTHTISASAGGQASIQFQDEGVNLGTAGTVDEVDFVGNNVTATRATNKVTVTIGGVEGITGNYIDNTDPVNPVSTVPLNNTTNTTPTVNDDSGDGYAIDSKWFDTTTGYLYNCTDATVGAAVWEQIIAPTTVSATNVSYFDDFVTEYVVAGTGGNNYSIYGNFSIQNTTGAGTNVNTIAPEQNHPGILRLKEGSMTLFGFSDLSSSPTRDTGLTFDNDFEITIYNRLRYNGTNNLTTTYRLSGTTNDIEVELADLGGVQTVKYNIGGGQVTTAVTVPTSTTWFKMIFTMVSGTLTAKIDNTTVYTGTPSFTGGFHIEVSETNNNNSTQSCDVDYVKTNYTVTR